MTSPSGTASSSRRWKGLVSESSAHRLDDLNWRLWELVLAPRVLLPIVFQVKISKLNSLCIAGRMTGRHALTIPSVGSRALQQLRSARE